MKEIWNQVLSALSNQISQKAFDIWIRPLKLLNMSQGLLEMEVPNKFFKDWITENYQSQIKDALWQITKKPYALQLHLKEEKDEKEGKPRPPEKVLPFSQIKTPLREDGLNPSYNFEAFVVGSCNQFAHAAALAVANLPAKNYNPLLVYGGVGLGKTHLLNAIGNHIVLNDPSVKVGATVDT
jgi:chromosomal replication initiator protein